MTDEDIKRIRTVVKEEIDIALKPVKKTLESHTQVLESHTRKLDILWDQTSRLTVDMGNVKEDIDGLKNRVEQMDRKLDQVIDKNIDYGNRINNIEQIPIVAHELKLKRRK